MATTEPRSLRGSLREAWRRLRGGELSPSRAAASVGIGLFVGCFPAYGLQTLLCFLLTVPLRLDFALAWVVTNFANPMTAPFLIALEIELGSLLVQGKWIHVSSAELRLENLGPWGAYALLGGAVLGIAAGMLGALVTFAWAKRRSRSKRREALAAPSLESLDKLTR